MRLLIQFRRYNARITEQFQSFLHAARLEIDLVLICWLTSAVLFTLLRMDMAVRIAVFHIPQRLSHLYGRLEDATFSHYYIQGAWLFEATWILLRQDIFYLVVLTILCLLVCVYASSAMLRRAAVIGYFIIMFASLLFLSINVELAPKYSTQLDYSFLRFSGLMSGPTTLMAMVPKSFVLAAAIVCVCLLAIPFLPLLKSFQTNRSTIRRSFCMTVVCGLIAVAVLPVPVIAGSDRLDERGRQNSLVYFLRSLVNDPHSLDLDLGTNQPSASAANDTIVLPRFGRPMLGAVNNVLLIVMESVGAEYFELLNDSGLLPTFSQMMLHGAYFNHAYVSAPFTAVSLVSITASTGPLPSYKLVVSDYPRARLTTSFAKLKSKGFATGFFLSGDGTYAGTENFLQDRGIDLAQDYRQRNCPETRDLITRSDSLSFRFSPDTCTASSLLDWIDKNRRAPFFAALWTEQTHYPYAASRECMNAVDASDKVLHPRALTFDADWPRYAAAVCDTDRMMAKIVSGLRERHLLENTLIIVTGDHGEGFGRHDSYLHGLELFEDQIRVPLLISAGNALAKRIDTRLASHLDIAPTIAGAFGIAAPDQWEGADLFSNRAPRRVFFYTAFGNFKIGYREADYKYIYDVTRRKLSAVDLAEDPYETEDFGGKDREADAQTMGWIGQWYRQRSRFAESLH
jgi:hypothetical protein